MLAHLGLQFPSKIGNPQFERVFASDIWRGAVHHLTSQTCDFLGSHKSGFFKVETFSCILIIQTAIKHHGTLIDDFFFLSFFPFCTKLFFWISSFWVKKKSYKTTAIYQNLPCIPSWAIFCLFSLFFCFVIFLFSNPMLLLLFNFIFLFCAFLERGFSPTTASPPSFDEDPSPLTSIQPELFSEKCCFVFFLCCERDRQDKTEGCLFLKMAKKRKSLIPRQKGVKESKEVTLRVSFSPFEYSPPAEIWFLTTHSSLW